MWGVLRQSATLAVGFQRVRHAFTSTAVRQNSVNGRSVSMLAILPGMRGAGQ